MTPDLDTLRAALRNVIAIAESGDWEHIAETPPETFAVRNGPMPPATFAALAESRDLLQRAMTLCQERIEQIAPLVEALSPKQPEEP